MLLLDMNCWAGKNSVTKDENLEAWEGGSKKQLGTHVTVT